MKKAERVKRKNWLEVIRKLSVKRRRCLLDNNLSLGASECSYGTDFVR